MATDSSLRPGQTYYLFGFEIETFTRLLIQTYEYIGKNIDRAPADGLNDEYLFRIVDSDGDQVISSDSQIWRILDVDGLIEKRRFSQRRNRVTLCLQTAMPNPAVNADVPGKFVLLVSRGGSTPVTVYR